MSAGAYVPYHTRQNKAIDRQLFIDLLTRLNRFVAVKKYRYISFGGPFFEDFKLIHSQFGIRKMISIEGNPTVFTRQRFNLPLSCIEPHLALSTEYLDSYSSEGKTIFWLDFAAANQLREQIEEFQILLSKSNELDVLRITLNANPGIFSPEVVIRQDGRRETTEQRNERRFELLQTRLGDFMPDDAIATDMTVAKYPRILVRALEFASNSIMEGRRLKDGTYFQPLSTYVYSDLAHPMLTLTGIVLNKKQRSIFFGATDLKRWEHASTSWGHCSLINVPALTPREKLFVDSWLPTRKTSTIQKKLKFLFADTEEESIEVLENYRRYYRYYPNFQRVIF